MKCVCQRTFINIGKGQDMNDIYDTPLVDLCWESEFGVEEDLESAMFMEAGEAATAVDAIDRH